MSARLRRLLVVGVVALASACSDDDAADTVASARSPTAAETPSVPTTAVESTEALTTTSASATTTTVPPTSPPTISVEDVKAEVVATYLELDAKAVTMLQNPRLRGLERRAAQIAIPGSPYFDRIIELVTDLVDTGRRAAPNDPDLRSVEVEAVRLSGRGPVNRAVVTVCQVDNSLLIVDADASPVPGVSIPVGGTGELEATRLILEMRPTPNGWRHASAPRRGSVSWKGKSECPAE